MEEKGEAACGEIARCPEHGKKLVYFCRVEKQQVCSKCAIIGSHRGHTVVAVEEAFRELKESLSAKLVELQAESSEQISRLEEIERNTTAAQEEAEILQRQVQKDFAVLRNFLDSEERALTELIAAEKQQTLEELIRLKTGCLQRVNHLKLLMDPLDAALQTTNLSGVLKSHFRFRNPYEMVNDSIVRFEAEKFCGPLQYKVWKKMFQVIKTVPEAYTFDHSTAHPHLEISANRRSVIPLREPLPVVYMDRRFNAALCVLGAEAFSTGKHYWEVTVNKKAKWDLGVAYNSISRHGNIVYSPSKGIWCLTLRDGCHYEACEEPEIQLKVQRKPCRIGIYVDYEGGIVSFFDAEMMEMLHVFQAHFTDPLLPLYSPCKVEEGALSDQRLSIFKLNM
ncbi:E3 ubiquitin-protein ligase TRIM62-like isoform X2 [Chiloscyllium plagiosum]|uniref:E3 ubiquitin-protein ligase TRIM62-like isoform X2 n=1 Tax=Chiloscyllium plagiosum TaxID=36176 RepID=UPI001CB7F0D9|nr:E3 ubiquitin-protein ligase TRIM62-like isoform X2 [Chiloscyllium plagiosum]